MLVMMMLLIILSLNYVDQKSNAVLTAAHCVRHFTQTPGNDDDHHGVRIDIMMVIILMIILIVCIDMMMRYKQESR